MCANPLRHRSSDPGRGHTVVRGSRQVLPWLALTTAWPAGSSSQIPDPVEPDLVLIDASERAYTVFLALPRNLPEHELDGLCSRVKQQSAVELASWKEFVAEKEEIFDLLRPPGGPRGTASPRGDRRAAAAVPGDRRWDPVDPPTHLAPLPGW